MNLIISKEEILAIHNTGFRINKPPRENQLNSMIVWFFYGKWESGREPAISLDDIAIDWDSSNIFHIEDLCF